MAAASSTAIVPAAGSLGEHLPFESVCKCSLFTGCMLSAKMIGHPGLDYGSGFPLIGFIKDINLSYALGANSGESPMGMNYSMGTLQNSALMSSA